jgi:hypothetical protein
MKKDLCAKDLLLAQATANEFFKEKEKFKDKVRTDYVESKKQIGEKKALLAD